MVATGGQDDKAFLWRVRAPTHAQTGHACASGWDSEPTHAAAAVLLCGRSPRPVALASHRHRARPLASAGPSDRRRGATPSITPQVGQDALEETGGTLGTFELSGHTDTIVSLAFSASGALLASASLDSTVRVWSAQDGACLRTLEGPADDVHWVAWHPRGDVVLAGSEDFSAWMWLARSGDCMQVGAGSNTAWGGRRGPPSWLLRSVLPRARASAPGVPRSGALVNPLPPRACQALCPTLRPAAPRPPLLPRKLPRCSRATAAP
jgi:WD40 repeat protein